MICLLKCRVNKEEHVLTLRTFTLYLPNLINCA